MGRPTIDWPRIVTWLFLQGLDLVLTSRSAVLRARIDPDISVGTACAALSDAPVAYRDVGSTSALRDIAEFVVDQRALGMGIRRAAAT
jgi:hypothetical protein